MNWCRRELFPVPLSPRRDFTALETSRGGRARVGPFALEIAAGERGDSPIMISFSRKSVQAGRRE